MRCSSAPYISCTRTLILHACKAPVNHTGGKFHPENAEEQLAVEENLPAVGRTRKPNSKDREEVEAEDNYQAKRSLGGYLSHVSTCINQVKTCLSELGEPDEIREAVKSLELAWTGYNDMYQCYIQRNVSVNEFERVENI